MKNIFKFYQHSRKKHPVTFYSFKVFEHPLWSFYYGNRLGWIRIFGKLIYWSDTTMYTMGFSERNGYRTLINIKNWRVIIS